MIALFSFVKTFTAATLIGVGFKHRCSVGALQLSGAERGRQAAC